MQFCDYIEAVELLKGNKLPSVEEQNGTFLANQKLFAEQLRAHEEFQKTINRILNSATQIDAEARKKQGMARIKEFAKEKQIDFPEADNMDKMANTLLLLRIMLVDIASTVNAYIHSGSEPEYAFNRRRLTITRFSTLEKLFGYVEDYRDSRLWAYIVKMIPQEDERLKMEAVSIEESLKTRIDAEDKEARVLFVHPLDKGENNIEAILAKLESMDPVLELNKAKALISTTIWIQQFLRMLMDKLAEDAHRKDMESTARLMAQKQFVRDLTNHPQCPEPVKAELQQKMDYFENLIKGTQLNLKIED